MTANDILALLPKFEGWTRRRAAQAVAARLADGLPLLGVAAAALVERDRLRGAIDEAWTQWRASAPVARTTVVESAFHIITGGRPDRRAARAIARGRLGLEAVAERAARDISRRETEAQVAFLAANALELKGEMTFAFDDLADRMTDDASWRLAGAALEALAARARARRAPKSETLERAVALAASPHAPVWTQVAALDLLAAALGSGAAPALIRRLRPNDEPDDLFVRAAAARALASVDPGAARERFAHLFADEPSEHVRIEMATLLGGLGDAGSLRRLVDVRWEASPRVRAAAAIALARIQPAALAVVLDGDPDDLPRRIALEEAEAYAAQIPALAEAIVRLSIGRSTSSPTLARLAAEAAERLHHVADDLGRTSLDVVRRGVEGLGEGHRRVIKWNHSNPRDLATGAAFGRAMAVVSTTDFGIEARPVWGGFAIRRGDRMNRRLWRALHEVRHPGPEKRQGHLHTIGRSRSGSLRAPSGRLAEVTATRVPGEPVLVPNIGDWGRHLPTVDDLLGRPRGGEALLFSAFGITRIGFPGGLAARAWARTVLTMRYAAYADLRTRSLASPEPAGRGLFVEAIRRLGFSISFLPHRPGAPAEVVEVFRGLGGGDYGAGAPGTFGVTLPPISVPALSLPSLGALARHAFDPSTSGASHLAALSAAAIGLFVIRLGDARRRIERAREAIPLTLGGWGTRGKSGTERLKAALFQGLGCEVLAKTTGCEAMFIHAIPGTRAQEVFIYRTYDKATIWEQQQLLELAARVGADVFLWECMALRPEYVRILEQHWMQDRICTLTNTYPDHENIQGPAGVDIPRAMVEFIPKRKYLMTAEESMLPILREGAESRQTALAATAYRDAALLPSDVLARFPYEEHPSNIALVLKIAQLMGIPRDMALKEMADWVIPDLGVLKTYAEARWRDRRLVFTNGMSANERTGFLNNWQRSGFDAPSPPGEWVVTVVNNRADRVSRSEVFADVLVGDAAAHAHVLIGTNLAGLRGYIGKALHAFVARIVLFHPNEQHLPAEQVESLAQDRAFRALAGVRLEYVGAERLCDEARALAAGLGVDAPLSPRIFDEALEYALGRWRPHLPEVAAGLESALGSALGPYAHSLGPHGPQALHFLAREVARHAAVIRWWQSLRAASASPQGRAHCEADFRTLYAELFLFSLVSLEDSDLTGDQVVDAIALASPPGYRVRIMGVQNIKGTGLDFAYRWIAFERTARAVARLDRAKGDAAVAVATEIAQAEDVGVLDTALAAPAIMAAAEREQGRNGQLLSGVAQELAHRHRQHEHALGKRSERKAGLFLRTLESVLDVYDGVRRRNAADRITDEVARGNLGHERAARELRELMKRQKGGWLGKG